MTEQELQIAVCKELGWKSGINHEVKYITSPLGKRWETHANINLDAWFLLMLPHLTLDLMHEAEKTLTKGQVFEYQELLTKNVVTISKLFSKGRDYSIDGYVIHATAIQRATAFIAVKQKGI